MAYNANYVNVNCPAYPTSTSYYYIIEVAVREESYSIETNKSRLYLEADITGHQIGFSGSALQYLEVYWYDTKNGEILGATTTLNTVLQNQLYQITGYIDVPHNDDGTLSGKAYTLWGKNGTNSMVPPVSGDSVRVEAPLTLTTIPRKSTATISGTPNIGSQITINTNRKSNSFTHTLTYTFGSLSGTIATNVGASTTWTIPTSFYAQIPNATSGTMVITCKTYNGTTLVGTTTTNVTCYVTNSNPTFNVAYQDTNSTTTTITGNNQQIIQNKSTVQFNITSASAKNSATLSSVKITINGVTQTKSISSATLNFDYGVVNVAQNINASVQLIDSRGLSTTKQVTLTILPWSNPTAIITLLRKSNYYSETDIKVDANYSSLASHNTISIKYRYKKTTTSTWSSYVNLSDNVTATFTADNQYEWDVQVVVQDRLATTTYNLTLAVGQPILFVDRRKRNVGVDCFPADTNAFEVQGNAQVNGNLLIKKNGTASNIFNLIYPVGSIYMSINSTNPSTLFGGTWTRLPKGKFLYNIDSDSASWGNGNSTGTTTNSHTLTVEQIPSHSHTVDKYYNTGVGGYYVYGSNGTGSKLTNDTGINATGGGKGHSHNIPYISVYMWRRTA